MLRLSMASTLQPPPKNLDFSNLSFKFQELGRWFEAVYKLLTIPLILRFTTTAVSLTITDQELIKSTAVLNLTLPTAVGNAGRILSFDNAHAGTTTILPVGAETVAGGPNYTLTGDPAHVALYSDGANWRIAP
jgi:hypothetical protein